jgi:RNA methyltransferase, TrmH family
MLTSAQNTRVKLARQIQQRRETREEERLFAAEGARLTNDFLNAGMRACYALITDSASALEWQYAHRSVECLMVSDAVMRSISLETTPPGVLVVFEMPTVKSDLAMKDTRVPVLILDGLRDPGNMGACLRVAAGAGCEQVILTSGSVDAYNPKVVRGGMGAHARLKLHSMEWGDIRSVYQQRHIWVAEASGAIAYDAVDWREPGALVIGSEADGISAQARTLATGAVSIPMSNQLESLNAAVACGVILFEAARQRRNA